MIDDIRWLEIPAAEWQGGMGIYDEATRTVRCLQVRFADAKEWCTVPIVRLSQPQVASGA
jgi:hypothetical protein